jgi:hypothetical protein
LVTFLPSLLPIHLNVSISLPSLLPITSTDRPYSVCVLY